MPNGETTTVRNPLGSIVEIPTAQLQAAQQQGYQVATPTEARGAKLEAEYGGAGQQALALGAGALGGLTFGASDYLISKSSDKARESLAAWREVHPGTVLAGEVIGGLGGLALSGGTGAAARLVSAPTRGVTALSRFAGGGGKLLGTGKLGRLATAGLEAGVEAGVETLGHTIGEAAIQNQELTGEKMAAALGTGALYGGIFGAGVSGVGMGLGAAKNRLLGALGSPDAASVEKVAEGAFGEAAPGIGKRITNLVADVSATAAGKEQKAMRTFMDLGSEGREARRLIFEGAEDLDGIAARMSEDLEAGQRAFDDTKFAANSGFKRNAIRRNIRTDNVAEQFDNVRETYQKSRDVLEEIKADADKYWGQKPAAKLERRLQRFEQQLGDAIEKGDKHLSATAYADLDGFKREVQKFTKSAQNRVETQATAPATVELLRALDDEALRPLLQSNKLWGDIATAQRMANKAWTEGLGGGLQRHHREFFTSYAKDPNNPYGKFLLTADTDKIRKFFSGLDNPNKNIAMRALRDAQQFKREYAQTMLDTLDLTPHQRKQFEAVLKGADATDKFIGEAGKKVALQNQFQRLAMDDGSGVLGAAVGGAGGYMLGGDEGMGATLGGAALGAALKPAILARRLAAAERLAMKLDGKISAGTRKIFRQAKPAAVKVAAPATRAAARAEDRQQRIQAERRQMAIESMAAQPGALQAELSSLYSGLAGSAPNTAALAAGTSQRALDYLASQLPPVPEKMGLLSPKAERLSPSEAVTFNRKAKAVEEPWSLLDRVTDGDLTTDEVDAVEATKPALLEDIRTRALEDVMALQDAGKTLPYETAGQLSTLLGVPVLAAHNPEMAAAAQAAFAARAAQPPPKMTPRPRENVADYASEMQTPREQLGQVEA